MGFPLRWLYSIRTDTGFFPPGRERDSGGGCSLPSAWTPPSVDAWSNRMVEFFFLRFYYFTDCEFKCLNLTFYAALANNQGLTAMFGT